MEEGTALSCFRSPGDFALLCHHHRWRFSEMVVLLSLLCDHLEEAHLYTFLLKNFYLSVTHSLSSSNVIILQRF